MAQQAGDWGQSLEKNRVSQGAIDYLVQNGFAPEDVADCGTHAELKELLQCEDQLAAGVIKLGDIPKIHRVAKERCGVARPHHQQQHRHVAQTSSESSYAQVSSEAPGAGMIHQAWQGKAYTAEVEKDESGECYRFSLKEDLSHSQGVDYEDFGLGVSVSFGSGIKAGFNSTSYNATASYTHTRQVDCYIPKVPDGQMEKVLRIATQIILSLPPSFPAEQKTQIFQSALAYHRDISVCPMNSIAHVANGYGSSAPITAPTVQLPAIPSQSNSAAAGAASGNLPAVEQKKPSGPQPAIQQKNPGTAPNVSAQPQPAAKAKS